MNEITCGGKIFMAGHLLVASLFLTGLASAELALSLPTLAWKDGRLVRTEQFATGESETSLEDLIHALLSPAGETLTPLFGRLAKLKSLEMQAECGIITLDVPEIEARLFDNAVQSRIAGLLYEWVTPLSAGHPLLLRLRTPEGNVLEIRSAPLPLAHKPEPPQPPQPRALLVPRSPGSATGQPRGALSDASIFLNPSHGWHYNNQLGRWATQRGNTNGLIEDLNSGEWVFQYLCQYLWNAGARVYTARERDLNRNMVIVTPGGPGHSQTGSWSAESLPGAYAGSQRFATTTAGSPTARALYTPDIPEDGHYAVYVWYRTSGGGATATAARITVHHSGDSTVWTQNQTRDGYTWKYIGTYYFEKGRHPATGSVEIDNTSPVSGQRVIAGAVRFGGGMGDLADPAGGGPSGKPRWEESGRYQAGFLGKSDWASFGPVDAMPRWAAWEHESWENGKSVYVSLHTNAAGGRGTETFAYASSGAGGAFNGVPGGLQLRDAIHGQLIRDLRAAWDPNWIDRGRKTHWFGEINPDNNPAMPGTLVEIAFHDNATDAKYLADPGFRRDTARAVYKGLVRYYSSNVPGFTNSTWLPEPPQNFRLRGGGSGQILLQWEAPEFSTGPDGFLGHAATSYRVYQSRNGRGFDNGTAVSGTQLVLAAPAQGETRYYRVAAVNAGGESFPTSTLAVRRSPVETKKLLIVNGFTRNDRLMNMQEPDPYSSTPLTRGYVENLNTGNYIIQHAQAIAAYPKPLAFDSCEAAALDAGKISLTNYDAVIWMGGLQSQKNDIGNEQTPAFSPAMQSLFSSYQNRGGKLFISGAHLAWDLARENRQSMLVNNFHVTRTGATQATHLVSLAGSLATPWNGTMEPPGIGYPLGELDQMAAANGGSGVLAYQGSGPIVLDALDSVQSWWQPAQSGSTTAGGSFALVASPRYQGSGAARLDYNWGPGNFIRVHRATQPVFSVDTDLSIWVYGDGSGHRLRLSVTDSDGELWTTSYQSIHFTGWGELRWPDLRRNLNYWVLPGDGVVTGPNVSLESIQMTSAPGGRTSGSVVLDHITATPVASYSPQRLAAVSSEGRSQTIFLGFPFEKISGESPRAELMSKVLDFFHLGDSPYEEWKREMFTPAQLANTSISGDTASPAGDGIPNVLKYALGLDPWSDGSPDMPVTGRENGHLTFHHRRAKRATDMEFRIESSHDLANWSEWLGGQGEITVSSTGGVDHVVVRDPRPGPEPARQFLRLRVRWK